jgi:hypothetical protein
MSWHVIHNYRTQLVGSLSRWTPLRCGTLLLGLCLCLLLTTCNKARRHTTQFATAQAVLSASPNPVPAGDPDQPVGTTTITWDTGNGAIGDLYVKVDRQPETLMARGPRGRQEVRWIQFDSFYEFRLYTKKRSKLLAKVAVTRDN